MPLGLLQAALCAVLPASQWGVLSWNVHWQCGSDHIPGCREAATKRLLQLAHEHDANVIVAIEFEASVSQPINLHLHGMASGWTQINGSCAGNVTNAGDAMSLAVGPGFGVLKSDGGCLGGHAGGVYRADSRAFAVALVKPPSTVAGCPNVCVIGLHSPHVDITQGVDKIARVCGESRHGCTVAIGDWNAPVSREPFCNYTVADRWTQLVGTTEALWAAPDELTCCYPNSKYTGWDDHVVTNIRGAHGTAHVYPYQMSRFSNDTEEHMPIFVELVL